MIKVVQDRVPPVRRRPIGWWCSGEDIPGLGTWACAGVYAAVTTPGTVRVGDEVTVQGLSAPTTTC